MVDAAIIKTLLDLVKDEFSLFWNFKKEVDKLSSTLSSIDAMLEDADRKEEVKHKQTEDWLRKLKHVLYEVRDIMDECIFEDLRLQVNRRNASSSTWIQVTNSITLHFTNTRTRLKVGRKIKKVQEKLDQISSERTKYHLPTYDSNIHKFTRGWRQTTSLPSCSKVFGRDKEKKEIIDILLNNTSSVSVAKELSVLPIVGIGGLGKTTLAQMVFNDNEVSKHFNTKIWVCVSENFDIELVIKAILEEEKAEASLQELQKKVRDKLRGKRYLIVLDDVWNEKEEVWAQLSSILDCGSDGAFVLTTTRKRNVAEIMGTIQYFKLSSLSEDDCWLLFEERAFKFETPKTPNFVVIGKEIARKCNGVPLIAKTLGSQLRWKTNDENEWCIIRDSDIWEIFLNEKSDLLPILRLSYYDLPYNLRKCFVFCAIFPKDTVIEKEKLIQLWMAHGLIHNVKKQEIEDVGNTIWNELCWRSFFEDEKEKINWLNGRVDTTCKMHDLMHDLAQSFMKDECYIMNANISSISNDGLGRKNRHLTVMIDRLDNTSICSLKKNRGLQSIMLHGIDVTNVRNVMKELPSLRVFEGSFDNAQYQDLHDVGRLKHLRYLDLSCNRKITTLPNSICDLLNLQTLNLNTCSKLESLPKKMRDLINLRHLYLESCFNLKYMPRGIGQLKNLKTLSLFVIGEKETDCQLDELKELDVGGSLEIKNLGRVSDASIARGISMAKNTSINVLELDWGYTFNDADRHEKICETLEISTAGLKNLKMSNYAGVNPPKWVGKSSSPSTYLKSNESIVIKDGNEMIVLFPLLEKLEISFLKNLREVVSPGCLNTWNGAFPNLCKLEIFYCPKLGRLPPYLKALKEVSVWGECSDELLYSISNLSALTHLCICDMNERSVLFGAGKALMFDDASLSSQIIGDNNNKSEAAQLRVRSTFPSLQYLAIWECKKLRRLFDDERMIMEETLKINGCQNEENHHHLQGQKERTRLIMNSLTELYIVECPELMISVEEFENLKIKNCPLDKLKAVLHWSFRCKRPFHGVPTIPFKEFLQQVEEELRKGK